VSVTVALVLAAGCWIPPVIAPVEEPFRAPPCPYCAGNRGIEYATRPGQPVVAADAGVVTFAGLVAGTRYVVVEHTDGLRVTYGRLATIGVAQGAGVVRGGAIGSATEQLFVCVRRGDEYLDPQPFLGRWRRRARLVPIDGTPPRPNRPPTLECPGAGASR
jgi:hypothetical protein